MIYFKFQKRNYFNNYSYLISFFSIHLWLKSKKKNKSIFLNPTRSNPLWLKMCKNEAASFLSKISNLKVRKQKI